MPRLDACGSIKAGRAASSRLPNLAPVLIALSTFAILVCLAPSCLQAQRKKTTKLPVELDRGLRWHRDSSSGEIHTFTSADRAFAASVAGGTDAHAVLVRTQMEIGRASCRERV